MQVDRGRTALPLQAAPRPLSTPCPCDPPPASVHTAGLALGHCRCHPAVRSWTVCMNDGAALIHAVFLCTASSLPGGTDPTFPSISSATRPVYPPRGDDCSPASAQKPGMAACHRELPPWSSPDCRGPRRGHRRARNTRVPNPGASGSQQTTSSSRVFFRRHLENQHFKAELHTDFSHSYFTGFSLPSENL